MRKLRNYDGVHPMERPLEQHRQVNLALAPPARQAVRGIRDLRIRGTHESARIAHPRGVACGRAPSTGKQKVDGQRPSRSRVSARQLLLLCRLRRPSLQSPASLSHRFPTTPRRKHSRTRRLQRRLMRRAGCRVPAQFPPYHFSSTQKALLRHNHLPTFFLSPTSSPLFSF